MSTTDLIALRLAAMERLTAPGERFEVRDEEVRGRPTRVFANRDRTLTELLEKAAAYEGREYLVCGSQRLTFAQHGAAVASLAEAMRDRYGIGKGDRVAILSANNPEWIMSFWAAAALGAVTVAMNSHWSAREVGYGMANSRPRLVVADARRRDLLGQLDVPVLSVEEDIPALAAAYPGATLPAAVAAEDDPAIILYTSGTTGRPKGATHSHRNMLAALDYLRLNDALAAAVGSPQGQRRFMLATPLFHIASLHNLAVPRLDAGDTAIIYTGRFDVDRMLRLIERERVTNWSAVPTMASRLFEHGDLSGYDLSSLRSFTLGTAPASVAMMEKVRRVLPVASRALSTTYGLTESSTAATVATTADLLAVPGTVGRPVVNMEVQIRDAQDTVAPDGVEGEIYLRGATVMLGYWDNPEATEAAIGPDGFLRTGDLGVFENGYLRISSRRYDLIIRAGENVYPVEVENVLAEHPAVAECAVFGVAHDDLGEEVAAIVVLSADGAATEKELRDFAAGQLARYKVPSTWTLTTTPLPRNATGKVNRHEVAGRR